MIKQSAPIDFHWPTQEPFLFCAHHYDHYPAGNQNLGLDPVHFAGRQMGADFQVKDGFRLYHGAEVPGFPVHPHRGFETITIVRKGYADHADSLGAAGRYGEGDVQWMTAGAGVQHSEMFPLLNKDKENTLELFQIWLNLPKKNKMVSPDFKMLWANTIPKINKDKLEISIISGEYGDTKFYQAPKNSWAADPENQVNLLLVKLKKNGVFEYPSKSQVNRSLYFFEMGQVEVNQELISQKRALFVEPDIKLKIKALADCEFLLMEGKPIGEPVVQQGPFVMNTRQEIIQTIRDYQQTQFGGWKWQRNDMVHGDKIERFAKYPDGRIERPMT
ncbi:MAG: pirin family protein [Bacteriovoracaceae bacterium]|nr:pirin family protein [Bacteriovoracaceae bacterium]